MSSDLIFWTLVNRMQQLIVLEGMLYACVCIRLKILYTRFIFTCREFITEYTCTNTIDKSFFVRDSSKSFPSGHSSIAFFEAIFMIWYVYNTIYIHFYLWSNLNKMPLSIQVHSAESTKYAKQIVDTNFANIMPTVGLIVLNVSNNR